MSYCEREGVNNGFLILISNLLIILQILISN